MPLHRRRPIPTDSLTHRKVSWFELFDDSRDVVTDLLEQRLVEIRADGDVQPDKRCHNLAKLLGSRLVEILDSE